MSNPELHVRSKADLVTDYLRDQLQSGNYQPGERLVLDKIASSLGVSKVPVREAVTRLVGEGLLVHRTHVGPIVPEFSAHEVEETALMRVALESAALPSAIAGHTGESLADLERLLERMVSADRDFPKLNVEFHAGVIAPTPYKELYASVYALLERAQRYATAHTVPGYREAAHQEHLAILEALRRRDVEAVRALNADHVTQAAEKLARLVDETRR